MYRPLCSALALSLAAASPALAQFDAGVFLGRGYYAGDLQVDTDLLPYVGAGEGAYGLYGRYLYNDRLALTASATTLTIGGDDARRENTRSRNLSFSSTIYEAGIAVEYYPFSADGAIAPYLTFGGAYYHHNPKTEFNGRTVGLRDLGTEGQGTEGYAPRYSLHRWAIPAGAGVRIAFGSSWVIGVEARLRMTFFDYLDDVSGSYVNYYELAQNRNSLSAALADRTHELTGTEPRDIPTGTLRGNPSNLDYYMTAGVTLGYRLGSGAFGSGGGVSRYNKCYSF